jgi:hypothetical protein
MSISMQTTTVTVIDRDAIKEWIAHYLAPACPPGSHISVINRQWHCKGESAFFTAVDVELPLSIEQLRESEVVELTRGNHLHFFVDDVIAAAVGSCSLAGSFFHVHYRW